MEFGMFYEWQMPKGISRADESRHFLQMMDQIKLAEAVGFTSVWSVEHHFLESFSHASAPEVLLTWIAAQTSTIRIGHGVRLLPYPYNHPIRAAEQAATLDLLSQGRLEFGTGRSVTSIEMGGFNINPAETREMWQSLELILKAWTNEIVEHDGKYFHQEPRVMVPKPLQYPHPPIWMACTTPESHAIAAQLGMGVLSFTLALNPDEVAQRVDTYRLGIKDAVPVGKFVNNQVGLFTLTHCAPTAAEARRRAEPGVMQYMHDQIDMLTSLTRDFSGESSSYEYYQKFVGVDYDKFDFEYLSSRRMITVGDPAFCLDMAQMYSDMGVDRMLTFQQFKDMSHEDTMDSIRAFGEKVIAKF